MPRLKNTVDCNEDTIINLIQETNGNNFIAGFIGYGEKFKAKSGLMFEVICKNKPKEKKRYYLELNSILYRLRTAA